MASLLDPFWITADNWLALRVSQVAKFGREEDLLSPARVLEPLANQALVSVRAVYVGGVPEGTYTVSERFEQEVGLANSQPISAALVRTSADSLSS